VGTHGRVKARAAGLPAPDPAWAWFLDVDGTLAELAETPELARMDEAMRARLEQLRTASGGAVALVSGRPIADVDAMLGAGHHVVAGLHGLERRDVEGMLWRHDVDAESLRDARDRIAAVIAQQPALLLEDKGSTIALHYRSAPALASFVYRAMREARQMAGEAFMLQRGKCVVELKPAGQDKGTAVETFMREPPFRGRLPVYLGDDATDEHAFGVVNALGGHSIKVGRGASRARWRLADVAAVREWLDHLATQRVARTAT
jgi:trehalose 6-phosphate phosphatase